MKKLIRNGEIRFNAKNLPLGITVYVDGDTGGGTLQIEAAVGNIRAVVADAGPFDEANTDGFGEAYKRIVIAGRADEIIVCLKDAVNPHVKIEVI